MGKSIIIFAIVSVMLVCNSVSQALIMEWVTVGDAGNTADVHGDGYGSVDYVYSIGKYEVTNSQYCEFLNAVAGTDTYGLYTIYMNEFGGITQSGSEGSYTYSVKTGYENKPANYICWYDAIRFINWMHNGQGSSSTESGAYTITNGGVNSGTVSDRNPGAQVWLPSEDEWYKAAYYKGGSTNAGYWDYATQNDTEPTAEAPPGGSNSANYYRTGGDITDVGAYVLCPSAYGTYDQSGNMFEWNEALIDGNRGLRGGSYATMLYKSASDRFSDPPDYENSPDVGFRVASPTVSEPYILTVQTEPNFVNTITPTVGQHTCIGWVGVNAQWFINCPQVYVFDHWEGDVADPNSAITSVLMDSDKTTTAVFVDGRKCGDECHPDDLFGDYNHDCIINVEDFAEFALNWLVCMKPECD